MRRLLFDERWQLIALCILLLLFAGGCVTSPALRKMCVVQEGVLERYVEVANEAITKDEQLLPEHRADWTRVGEKLVRNQKTISKLAGVKVGNDKRDRAEAP